MLCRVSIGNVWWACRGLFASHHVRQYRPVAGGVVHGARLIAMELTWINALMWVGFASGVMASVWSQTRGGWVAIVLVFFWILIHATQHWSWTRKLATLTVLVGCMGILGAQVGLTQVVGSRVAVAITETTAFFNPTNKKVLSALACQCGVLHSST